MRDGTFISERFFDPLCVLCLAVEFDASDSRAHASPSANTMDSVAGQGRMSLQKEKAAKLHASKEAERILGSWTE